MARLKMNGIGAAGCRTIAPAGASFYKVGHDLFREEVQGVQHLPVLDAAEVDEEDDLVHAGLLQVVDADYYKDHMVERLERVRGEHKSRIDYRHIIWSLVRKPGAFARYRFREHLFPTPVFRQAYDALGRWHGGRTDVEYIRILHLAASTLEARVERALSQLLLTGRSFDYATVQELAAPTPPQIPQLPSLSAPDLKVYDALLQGVG